MPAKKSDVKITVEANGKRFSLNCRHIMFKKYEVKVGRTKSKKPLSTITEITSLIRQWIVKKETSK